MNNIKKINKINKKKKKQMKNYGERTIGGIRGVFLL